MPTRIPLFHNSTGNKHEPFGASDTLDTATFPALTGDITNPSGTVAVTIANNAVTNAKSADMATQTIKGRTTAGTGDPEDLTATQATAVLSAMVGADGTVAGTKGLAPAPAATDNVKYLRGDGTWQTLAGGGSTTDASLLTSGTLANARLGAFGSGDVSFAAAGGAGTIANDVVTNAKAADMAAYTLKFRNAAASGDPLDVNATTLTADNAPTSTKLVMTFDPATGEAKKTPLSGLPSTALSPWDGTSNPPPVGTVFVASFSSDLASPSFVSAGATTTVTGANPLVIKRYTSTQTPTSGADFVVTSGTYRCMGGSVPAGSGSNEGVTVILWYRVS